MKSEFKILSPDDIGAIQSFQNDRLAAHQPDEFHREMLKWDLPWRLESLEYYSSKGWSFVIEDEASHELVGFSLGQVIPFFRSQTQALWVEYVDLKPSEHLSHRCEHLVDMLKRYGREKHLQSICIGLDTLIFSDVREAFARACHALGGKAHPSAGIIEISVGKTVPS